MTPQIMAVEPGSISVDDKAALREAGVIVIETDDVEKVRLIHPAAPIPAVGLFECALAALNSGQGSGATHQREQFVRLMLDYLRDANP